MTRRIATTMIALGFLLTPLQAAGESPHIKQVPLSKKCVQTLDGETLYQEMCASCHGDSGHGDATAIQLLTPPPADLTRLAAKNGGEFPTLRVMHTISGRYRGTPLGSDMPKWERILARSMGENQAQARLRVYNLARYLENLQEVEAGETSQGK